MRRRNNPVLFFHACCETWVCGCLVCVVYQCTLILSNPHSISNNDGTKDHHGVITVYLEYSKRVTLRRTSFSYTTADLHLPKYINHTSKLKKRRVFPSSYASPKMRLTMCALSYIRDVRTICSPSFASHFLLRFHRQIYMRHNVTHALVFFLLIPCHQNHPLNFQIQDQPAQKR